MLIDTRTHGIIHIVHIEHVSCYIYQVRSIHTTHHYVHVGQCWFSMYRCFLMFSYFSHC